MKHVVTIFGVCAMLGACSPSASVSSGTSPSSGSSNVVLGTTTLRVVNTTAYSFAIRAAPILYPPIPQPSAGVMALGSAGPGTTCILLPSRFYDFVTHVPTGQLDTLVWLSSTALSIVALGQEGSNLSASTPYFVPDSATAWSVTLSGGGTVAANPDTRCTP